MHISDRIRADQARKINNDGGMHMNRQGFLDSLAQMPSWSWALEHAAARKVTYYYMPMGRTFFASDQQIPSRNGDLRMAIDARDDDDCKMVMQIYDGVWSDVPPLGEG